MQRPAPRRLPKILQYPKARFVPGRCQECRPSGSGLTISRAGLCKSSTLPTPVAQSPRRSSACEGENASEYCFTTRFFDLRTARPKSRQSISDSHIGTSLFEVAYSIFGGLRIKNG